MKSLSNDDYLRLLEDLNAEDDIDISESEPFWMPADPPAKEKIKPPGMVGAIDVSNIKKHDLQKIIYNHTSMKIGIFLIRVTKYHSLPGKNQDLKMDLSFWHEVYKTPSGAPCKMTYKFDIGSDKRFSNCSWLSYLTDKSSMKEVSIDTVVEVIRWFQGIHRMTAFL